MLALICWTACLSQVISDKANKTILVAVDRWMIVPKYKVKIKRTSKFMAHDENNDCRMGDIVRIHISRCALTKRGGARLQFDANKFDHLSLVSLLFSASG